MKKQSAPGRFEGGGCLGGGCWRVDDGRASGPQGADDRVWRAAFVRAFGRALGVARFATPCSLSTIGRCSLRCGVRVGGAMGQGNVLRAKRGRGTVGWADFAGWLCAVVERSVAGASVGQNAKRAGSAIRLDDKWWSLGGSNP